MKYKVAIAQLDFNGIQDPIIEVIDSEVTVTEHMKENGYKLMSDSAIFFRRGRKVRYAVYCPEDHTNLNFNRAMLEKYQELIAAGII